LTETQITQPFVNRERLDEVRLFCGCGKLGAPLEPNWLWTMPRDVVPVVQPKGRKAPFPGHQALTRRVRREEMRARGDAIGRSILANS
jgi:hypothetical protein